MNFMAAPKEQEVLGLEAMSGWPIKALWENLFVMQRLGY